VNPNVSDPQQKSRGKVNFKCSDVGRRTVIDTRNVYLTTVQNAVPYNYAMSGCPLQPK
jgi:hypothetical protein